MAESRLAALLAPRGTKIALSRATNIPPPRISEYIKGVRQIPARHLVSICNYLQVRPEQVLGVIEDDQ